MAIKKDMGAAHLRITGDNKGLSKALKKAQSGITKFKGAAVKAFKGAAIGVGALTAAMGAVILATDKALGKLDKIAKSAKNIGLGGEAFQEWAFAADLAGVSIDLFQKSVAKLEKAAEDSLDGLVTMERAFKKMNISIEDLRGAAPEELLDMVADGMAGIEDPVQQAAVAMQLFGVRGLDMLELLGQGSDNIKKLRIEARELGIVFSQEMLDAAEDNNDKLTTMKKIVDVAWVKVWADLAPEILNASDAMASLTTTMLGGVVGQWKQFKSDVEETLVLMGLLTRPIDYKSISGLNREMDKLDAKLFETRNAIKEVKADIADGDDFFGTSTEEDIRELDRLLLKQQAVEEEMVRMGKIRDDFIANPPAAPAAEATDEEIEAERKARQKAIREAKVKAAADGIYEGEKAKSLERIAQMEIRAIDNNRERAIAQVEHDNEKELERIENLKITEGQKHDLKVAQEQKTADEIVTINRRADEEVEENRVKAMDKAAKERQKVLDKAAKETAAREKEVREAIGDIATELATAAADGTLDFDKMFEGIIAGAIRAQIQIALMGKASAGGGAFGGGGGGLGGLLSMGVKAGMAYYTGGASTAVPGAGAPVAGQGGGTVFQNYQPRAGGGRVYKGQSYTVGELRSERFTPDSNGSIDPHPGSGGTAPSNISVNVNNSGEPKNAQVKQSGSGAGMVIDILLEDMEQNGKFSRHMGNTFGVKRTS